MLENLRLISEVLNAPTQPPPYLPFDFQISNRLAQPFQKLLTGSPAAYPPVTHSYLLVGTIESPQPLQRLLALSVIKASFPLTVTSCGARAMSLPRWSTTVTWACQQDSRFTDSSFHIPVPYLHLLGSQFIHCDN